MATATIAVITPAFRATEWIGAAARSVLAQSHGAWEHWIVSDDGVDYAAVLERLGLADRRQRHLTTGEVAAGASRARNLALDATDARRVAILDADDQLAPEKLATMMAAFETHALVSSALDVCAVDGRLLRQVGDGPDRVLTPGRYKFTNLSMDSMIGWDRTRCDARYDTGLSNMTDLELLMQLWTQAESGYHLGRPLHRYFKVSSSMSNGEGFSAGMIRSKRELLRRVEAGHYAFKHRDAAAGLALFLEATLAAEAAFPAALAADPALLFEDHLEPRLAAAQSSRAATSEA